MGTILDSKVLKKRVIFKSVKKAVYFSDQWNHAMHSHRWCWISYMSFQAHGLIFTKFITRALPFLGQLTNFMRGFGPKITNSLTKNPEGNFWSAIKVVLLIWNSNLEWTLTFNGNGQKATSHPSCGIFFRSGAYLYSGEFTNAAIFFFDKLSNNHRFSNNNDQILYTQWSNIENPIQK